MFRATLTLALGTSLVLTPFAIQALELTAAAELGAEYRTNSRRSSFDDESDIILTPGINGRATHEGPNLRLDAQYDIKHRYFKEDFEDDETILTGYGNLQWSALPERLDVRVTQTNNENTRQSFDRGTQSDRQIITSTEASPTLKFRVRRADELQLQYTYTYTDSEDDDIDNERQVVTGRYIYAYSPSTTISLAASFGDTAYDLDGVPDVDSTSYTLTFDSAGQSSQLSLMGGYSLYERRGEPDADGPVWNLEWSTQTSAQTTFSFGTEREITDRSEELLDIDTQRYNDINYENTDLTDVFESTSAFISVTQPFGATSVDARLSWDEADYERVPRDETQIELSASATRQLRRQLEANVQFSFANVEYEGFDADYDQYTLETSVLWDVNRRFEAEGGVFYVKREGSVISGDYDDLGFFVTARYFFSGDNTAADRRARPSRASRY
ncbi:MAG: hypothetical protein ACR2PZ_04050 [Pseudomonadales bacterium]